MMWRATVLIIAIPVRNDWKGIDMSDDYTHGDNMDYDNALLDALEAKDASIAELEAEIERLKRIEKTAREMHSSPHYQADLAEALEAALKDNPNEQ
jgi:hypothetical protein